MFHAFAIAGEIEDLIKTHPSVVEAQVVGCPPSTTIGGVVQESTTTGDVAVAFCIMREGGTKGELSLKKEIVDLCRRKLANYKVPAEVWFVTEYPVTVAANGTKVQRHRLREMARERGVTLERGRGVEGPKIGARL